MSRNSVTPKIFLLLLASATLVSGWVLPSWLWQFGFLREIFF